MIMEKFGEIGIEIIMTATKTEAVDALTKNNDVDVAVVEDVLPEGATNLFSHIRKNLPGKRLWLLTSGPRSRIITTGWRWNAEKILDVAGLSLLNVNQVI
jgi:hypothetical protein